MRFIFTRFPIFLLAVWISVFPMAKAWGAVVPQSAEGAFLAGRHANSMHQRREALEYFQHGWALVPEDMVIQQQVLQNLLLLGKIPEAVFFAQSLKDTAENKSETAELVHLVLAIDALHRHRYNAAYGYLTWPNISQPSAMLASLLKGWILCIENRKQEALQTFDALPI